MAVIAALCLAAGALHARLPLKSFTLRWQHSIEKIEWAEDYDVVGSWLVLTQARIRGSGAGMDPPPNAQLVDGVWHYRLADPWRHAVVLARSEFVPDYELCIEGAGCQRLWHWVPVGAGTTTLSACTMPREPGPDAAPRP